MILNWKIVVRVGCAAHFYGWLGTLSLEAGAKLISEENGTKFFSAIGNGDTTNSLIESVEHLFFMLGEIVFIEFMKNGRICPQLVMGDRTRSCFEETSRM